MTLTSCHYVTLVEALHVLKSGVAALQHSILQVTVTSPHQSDVVPQTSNSGQDPVQSGGSSEMYGSTSTPGASCSLPCVSQQGVVPWLLRNTVRQLVVRCCEESDGKSFRRPTHLDAEFYLLELI